MEFLVFSDLHLNKFPRANITKDGENELLLAGLNIIDQVYSYARDNDIKNIIFTGDLFHIRSKVDTEVYTDLLYKKLDKYFGAEKDLSLILIPGNHDQINKTGKHLLFPLSKISRVFIIDKLHIHKDTNVLFCPHQYKLDDLYAFLEKNSNDKSYIFMHQLLVNSPSMSGQLFRKNEAVDISRFKYKYVFSGHNHRPFENKKLNVYNIGSPMHYDFGDVECQDRFFLHFNNGRTTWVKTEFPHFAVQGTPESKKAKYIKRETKKVQKQSSRIEISFNNDVNSVLKAYTDSEETLLNKDALYKKGLSLLTEENNPDLQE